MLKLNLAEVLIALSDCKGCANNTEERRCQVLLSGEQSIEVQTSIIEYMMGDKPDCPGRVIVLGSEEIDTII